MDSGQPAHVGRTHNRMFTLGPCQEVTVLFVAVVDGLVARSLRIHIDDGIENASGRSARCQSGSQGNEAGLRGARSGSLQRKLRCGSAGARDREVLPAANPTAAEAVQKVRPKLPVKAADDGIPAKLRTAGCTRRAPQVNLKTVRTQAAGIGVAAEKVHFIRKVVVQFNTNAVRFK